MGVSDVSDVFVSYRRLDVDFTKQLVEQLQALGKEVWIDWEDIPPGSVGFADDIKRGIEGADTFIAILSPDYLESPYCVDMELQYAIDLNKKLIPIVLHKFDGYDVPAGISHINWIYFTPHAGHQNEFDESFQKIVQVMETDLEHQRTHKRFLLRAIEWDEHNRGNSFLLSGDEIAQAEHWLADSAGKEPFPAELQKDYIALSRETATAFQRRLLTGVSGALVLTVFLAIFAGFQWRNANIARQQADIARDNAETQREIAERQAELSNSLALASGASEISSSNQIEALGLALEAINLTDPPGLSQRVLGEIAYQPGAIATYQGLVDGSSAVATSPDGTLIAAGSADGVVMIWQMATGEEVQRFSQHEDEIATLAFNADASQLAVGSDDRTISIWDTATGENLFTLEGHGRSVNALAFSPDDSTLASGSSDETVMLWDTATGDLLNTIEAANRVFGLDFHPDGTQIAIGDRDGFVTLWDIEANEALLVLEGHSDDVTTLAYVGDGSQVLSGSSDLTVILWDTGSGAILRQMFGHSRLIRAVAVSPDGQYAVTGGDDRSIILWRLATGEAIHQFSGVERVKDLAFMPDSNRFVSADGTLNPIAWTIREGSQIAAYDDGDFAVSSVDISPDGQRIVTGSSGFYLHVYTLESDEILTFEEHQNAVTAVAFSTDNSMIASTDSGGIIYLWDAATGEILFDLTQEATPPLETIAFSPDGQYLAVGGGVQRTAALYLFDIATGDLIRSFEGHIGTVHDIDFSPDSTILAAAEEGNQIILWDVTTGEILHTLLAHTAAVEGLAFSPDGTQVASASFDQSMILWDVTTGEIVQQFFGHSDVIRAIDFNPDGQYIITAGSDRLVLIWDINDPNAEAVRAYSGHSDNIMALSYSQTGDFFASVSTDTTLILWRYDSLDTLETWVADNRLIPDLQCNTQRQFRLTLAATCE